MDAGGQDVLAAAGLTGQQHRGRKFADPLGQLDHAAGLRVFADQVLKAVPRHKAALVQLPAHLAVHLDQALAFLECQHRALDLSLHQDGGHVDHNGLVADVQQERVGLLAVAQRILQHAPVQIGQHGTDLLAQQVGGGAFQQVVADAVHAADDALLIHLDDAAERVVEQGVDLGTVPFFQVDGVGHLGGHLQRIAQALLPGGDKLVGQVFAGGYLTHDVAADHAAAAIGDALLHRTGQLVVLLHHIKGQVHLEQVVELGSIAEHVRHADQRDLGPFHMQLLLELHDHGSHLLLGDVDLHQRHLDAALGQGGLHAAGHQQVVPLALQFLGAGHKLAGVRIFNDQ